MITLNVHSIFKSISGEVGLIPQGAPAVFLRLAGCNLKCSYCDTAHIQAKDSGKEMDALDIVKKVLGAGVGCNNFVITGGEPLLQKNLVYLIGLLQFDSPHYCTIQIETNGSLSIQAIKGDICVVMDFKFGQSPKYGFQFKENLNRIKKNDWVKFVCEDETQYDLAKKMIITHDLLRRCNVALSAVHKEGWNSNKLGELILRDNLNGVVLNVQLHKLVGME